MFNFISYWFWIFLVLYLIIIAFGKYKTKKLPPKQKALATLYYSFVGFGFYVGFLVFFILLGNGFNADVPHNTTDIKEIQNILLEQNLHIFNIKTTLIFFFLFFVADILPTIYGIAKMVMPADNDKILNVNIEEKKPILGLNVE